MALRHSASMYQILVNLFYNSFVKFSKLDSVRWTVEDRNDSELVLSLVCVILYSSQRIL